MKTRFLTFLALVALLAATSCRSAGPGQPAKTVDQFFRKYEGRSGFKVNDWSAGFTTRLLLLKLGSLGGDNSVTQALSAVRSVKVLTFVPSSGSARQLVAEGLNKEVDGLLASERYTPLPASEAGTAKMRYAARQQGDKVQEVVATGNVDGAPESFMMVAVSGNFTQEQLQQLIKFLPKVKSEMGQ
ncbi:protein of unknown function [Hymenobacter daecheongensis DSM 21074]|uniref:DUF4252 domain-containing protein n=1 Tax=Hymenobacter daecheongensis DSM 21074 TaxID=1121955 RepID=A0A1M6CMR3_9BACT|nr:DUF4252 domain-containing protein [Hymenobacter daecheongensis]SHI62332.1 protein of unknown function [Hymenobacter daecheongensis DSM 21074]